MPSKTRSKTLRAALLLAPLVALSSCARAPKPPPVVASDEPAGAASLTIYSSADPATFLPDSVDQYNYGNGVADVPGFGVLRETRKLPLTAGTNRVELTRIATGIDPTTVAFRSLTDPAGTSVIEQNLEFDLTNPQKMLQRFLGKEVVFVIAGKDDEPTELKATLLSTPNSYGGEGPSYVIRAGGPNGPITVQSAERVKAIKLPDSRGTIISKPTLNWRVQAAKPGTHDVEIGYQTNGITWRADYGLLLSADEKQGAMSAWVSILNRTGLQYDDAKLKLIAGKVRRITPIRRGYGGGGGGGGLFGGGREPEFEEQPFSDYHLYTLSRTTTIPDNSTKQIELFPVQEGVVLEKGYMWTGPTPNANRGGDPADESFVADETGAINILIKLKNTKAAGLGVPLPAGRVRVYKVDAKDGSREFIGEDIIDHTPVDEPLLLHIGVAFDLVGKRTQTKFERDGRVITESFEVSIRNRKAEPAKVVVREFMYRYLNWQITESSQPHKPVNAKSIDFELDLKPGEEKKVSYTVKYTW